MRDLPRQSHLPRPWRRHPCFPPVVTLRQAVQSTALEAQGFNPGSYKSVSLRLTNRGDAPLRIDLCASYLRPNRRGSCQRLGLGPVVTPRERPTRRPPQRDRRSLAEGPDTEHTDPPGTVVVALAAGEERVVRVRTCCLDAGKAAPGRQTFHVAKARLPKVRETVLRWWADNPAAPQGAVNAAIWQNRDTVHVPESSPFYATLTPVPVRVAAHAGVRYVLHSDGELLSIDPDGLTRFLGTELLDVYPTASAVYGVAHGRGADAPLELWRLVLTGDEGWRRIAPLPPEAAVHDVQVSPKGIIFVITGKGVHRVDSAKGTLIDLITTDKPEHLSLRFVRRGITRITAQRPPEAGTWRGGERVGERMAGCEIHTLDKHFKLELDRVYWNVRQVLHGPLGVCGLSPAGKLRTSTGRSFRTAPGQVSYRRIVAVGTKTIWLVSKDERLVAADRGGRPRFLNGPRINGLTSWRLDRSTDDLVFIKAKKIYRLDAKTGMQEQILREATQEAGR